MVNANDEQQIRDDCVEVWRILVDLAPRAKSIFYSELARLIGMGTRDFAQSDRLLRIHHYCNTLNLAPLDVLVVLKGHWVPSYGYRETRENEDDFPGHDELICYDRERVRQTDWSQVPEPTSDDFAVG